jgi:MoaA/NifB/PqqE/SkfB family radical SAM enzyme
MDFSTFERVSRYFPLAEHVHLQGWGEPLLHGRIYDMIEAAKRAGCSVGFTTNGMLLREDVSRRMVELGVDIIGVSIAGASSGVHGGIRVNSRLDRLVENIAALNRIKKQAGSGKPRVVLSFLMTKTNIHELPDAVKLAARLGADELVATNLDYPSTSLQDELKVFSCEEANEEYEALIKKSKDLSADHGLSFRAYPLKIEEVIMCELNPVSYVYVSHDGLVSPCVYLNQTRSGKIPRIFCGEKYEVERTVFGDVNEEDLMDIWSKPEYRAFRMKYIRRRDEHYNAFGEVPFDFGFSQRIREAEERAAEALKKNPVPEECRTCYKAYGI